MMLSNAAILLSLAAGYVVAEECTIVTPSTIYGFATPSSSAVPTTCDRTVDGLCVVENAAPEGQALKARAVTVVETINGVSSIDVCISTYCIPDEECQSVGFDDSESETICYIYGEPLDFGDLEVAIGFSVAFEVGGGEIHESSTTESTTSTSSVESSTETSSTTTTTEESSSTTETSTSELASSTESSSTTETTSSETSSTTDFSSTSSESSSESSTESSSSSAAAI